MSIEYRLTIAGNVPVNLVAERAFPDPSERPTGTASLLSADLYDRSGFGVTIRADHNGYVEIESDQGIWEWEPETYLDLTFRMDKDADPNWAVINMLTVVRRVLATGPEDIAFTFNIDSLLLTRFDGTLVKHNRGGWWANYPGADQLIPG